MTTGFQHFMTKQITGALWYLHFALNEINIIRTSQHNLINSFLHEGKRKQALWNCFKQERIPQNTKSTKKSKNIEMFHDFYAAWNTSEVITSKHQIFTLMPSVYLTQYKSYSASLSLPPPWDVTTGKIIKNRTIWILQQHQR